MQTCKQCAFCHAHPAAGPDDPVGMCYGRPPATMLLPAQPTPAARIAAAGGPKGMSMSLESVRPSVLHADPACSLFQAAVKH